MEKVFQAINYMFKAKKHYIFVDLASFVLTLN